MIFFAEFLFNQVEDILDQFPELDDFEYGAAFGLVSVQNYYSLNYADMTEGKLIYPKTGKVYKSLHQLSPEDCQFIASAARRVLRFDKMVAWNRVALKRAEALSKNFGFLF